MQDQKKLDEIITHMRTKKSFSFFNVMEFDVIDYAIMYYEAIRDICEDNKIIGNINKASAVRYFHVFNMAKEESKSNE